MSNATKPDQATYDQAREWIGEHYPELTGEAYETKLEEVAAELALLGEP